MSMSIGMIVFLAAWATGLTSLLLLVVEALGVWRFSQRAFQLGLIVARQSQPLPRATGDRTLGEPFETDSGSFKLVGPDTCMFRSRTRRDRFRLRTPFPTRGYVRWQAGASEVEVRVPLSTSLFFAAWLTGWTMGCTLTWLAGGGLLTGLALLLGWTFALGVVWYSLGLELRHAQNVIDELAAELAGGAEIELEEIAEAAGG